MEYAIGFARMTWFFPLKMLAEGSIEEYSVKVRIDDGAEVEHVWLDEVSFQDGVFTGRIGNTPEYVKNVKQGDTVSVSKGDITDWGFVADDMMWGNFTLRVVVKKELEKSHPPENAITMGRLLAPMRGFDLDDDDSSN
jgi:uncharacterized protein YegJ (DUF2314 family)